MAIRAVLLGLHVGDSGAVSYTHLDVYKRQLLLKHIDALRHPILEYRAALEILWDALSQPVVLFAVLGGLIVLWDRRPEAVLPFIYCVVAWVVAILTLSQVGGNINYFWEPLLVSAMLPGRDCLNSKARPIALRDWSLRFSLYSSCSGFYLCRGTTLAVSYTHLDVYKRQVLHVL